MCAAHRLEVERWQIRLNGSALPASCRDEVGRWQRWARSEGKDRMIHDGFSNAAYNQAVSRESIARAGKKPIVIAPFCGTFDCALTEPRPLAAFAAHRKCAAAHAVAARAQLGLWNNTGGVTPSLQAAASRRADGGLHFQIISGRLYVRVVGGFEFALEEWTRFFLHVLRDVALRDVEFYLCAPENGCPP